MIKQASRFRIPEIEELRKELLSNHTRVDVMDIKTHVTRRKTISMIARTSSSSVKFASFLHLLANKLKIQRILETGSSLGLTTMYLASSVAEETITIEGSPVLAELAKKHLNQLPKAASISVINQELNDSFVPMLIKEQPDMIFLDAHHEGELTLALIKEALRVCPELKCLIVHDIYWSEDMTACWHRLVQDPRFPLTVDLFQAGLLFPLMEMPKQHFTLRF